ncbi:MAG TPA: hypothetical protein VGW37_11385 [Terriglobia bacterium]|nr:hypothetical protein [Terriglobia bacterium]
MTDKNDKIVLFEDDPQFGTQIEAAIRASLPRDLQLVRFESKLKQTSFLQPYEDALREELSRREYSNIVLIVSDRDLSKTERYTGLSEAIVSKVAAELGVPICLYARGCSDSVLDRQRSWGDGRIVLDSDSPARMASKIRVLAEGFIAIRGSLKKALALRGSKRPHTPAQVMAQVVGQEGLVDKIALYGSGDQKMVAEILPFATKSNVAEFRKRLPCLLGYWLNDSILRFPGLLVNTIAAASYLDIKVTTFEKDNEVQDLFKSALYRGPFATVDEPAWWRGKLDDLILQGNCTDGRSLAEKKLKRVVESCPCSVNRKIKAGYYCVATNQPVSLDNSKGNISWFPPGADLARIRNDVYYEMGPWLGLY